MISVGVLQSAVPAAVGADVVQLGNLIEQAVHLIQTKTRRYFGPISEVTEYIPGNGSRVLRLSEAAILDEYDELISVEEYAYPGATITDIGDYRVRSAEMNTSVLVRTDGSVWTKGLEYAVTYERGYGVDNGPPDIARLIIKLVEQALDSPDEEALQSETIGGVSYTRFKDTSLDEIDDGAETINDWRRAVFA